MAEANKVVRTGRQEGEWLCILSAVRLVWKVKNLETLQGISQVLSLACRSSWWCLSLLPIAYCLLPLIAYCLLPPAASAQGNYEIQVYGSDMAPAGTTTVELHSNYTVSGTEAVPGSRFAADGTEPTSGAVHETVEITQGFTTWFETGFYIFTSARSGFGYEWVGDHIRPRVRVPEDWHWPVGISLSNEIGYQRARFSPDTWTWEIRPIIDKQLGHWYLSFNPTLDRSWHGPSVGRGLEFSPNFKLGYNISRKVAAGFEYYANYGNLTGFDPFREQQQDFFPSIDLNVSPKWEFNFGVGIGATRSTDHLIVKGIVGRRFSFGRPHRNNETNLDYPN